MGNIIRLSTENEERLKAISENVNTAITHLLDRKTERKLPDRLTSISEDPITAINVLLDEHEHLKQLDKDKSELVAYFRNNYDDIFKDTKLSPRQEVHTKAIIQEELYKLRQGY